MLRLNQLASYGEALEAEDVGSLGVQAAREVRALLALCPRHEITALRSLPSLASQLRVARLFIKDESTRLGLGSFKALGGAHAVLRVVLELVSRAIGRDVDAHELLDAAVRSEASKITVCCATDGNHGRAVAAGARFVGCRAVIFLHAGVSSERAAAIQRLGAEIRRSGGTYQESVSAAAEECERQRWTLVSDTSWPGYERVPRLVAQGYTAMLSEVVDSIPKRPTHVFVQAGVGGLASAVAAHFSCVYGRERPTVIVVEPLRAACLYESVRAGRPVVVPSRPTVMAMLDCQEPSHVAWRVLSRAADAFMVVEEEDAVRAMKLLATPAADDPVIVAGESGGAGLAGLLRASAVGAVRDALGLDELSTVLLFNTEGATDPDSYSRIVGATPHEVAGRSQESGLIVTPA
jgi:diaminopropionate ammonia-lyase